MIFLIGCTPPPSVAEVTDVQVLAGEVLPGQPPRLWPIEVAAARGHALLPWFDGSWHARLDDRDLDFDEFAEGALIGVAALDGGFAVAFRDAVHFLDDEGRTIALSVLPGF